MMKEFLKFFFLGKKPECNCWVGNELKQKKILQWESGSWFIFINGEGWPVYVCPRCGKKL